MNFTTDDGNAATQLTLATDLSALPAGWSSSASSFSCAIVSTGNGCQLLLNFAPTAAGNVVLVDGVKVLVNAPTTINAMAPKTFRSGDVSR